MSAGLDPDDVAALLAAGEERSAPQLDRHAIVRMKAAETFAFLVAEENATDIETATRVADAIVYGALNWMLSHERGPERVAEFAEHLRQHAHGAKTLRDMPLLSEAKN